MKTDSLEVQRLKHQLNYFKKEVKLLTRQLKEARDEAERLRNQSQGLSA